MQIHNKTPDTDYFGLNIRSNFMILVGSHEVSLYIARAHQGRGSIGRSSHQIEFLNIEISDLYRLLLHFRIFTVTQKYQ